MRVALTGAAGSLATDILPGLAQSYEVVGIDQRPCPEGWDGQWFECSINDRDQLLGAFQGCDAVIHLAGIPLEDDWDALLLANIDGTQAVLETARIQGIRRVILASSIHAAGYTEIPGDGTQLPDTVQPRPNTYYGVTKVAVEALGSLYHDRYGMDVICLRIASRFAKPQNERMLSTWLSPADALRLFQATLATSAPGFRIVWGVSANQRRYLSSAGGDAIGFHPQDDAESFAAEVFATAEHGASEWDRQFIGGIFCSPNSPRMS